MYHNFACGSPGRAIQSAIYLWYMLPFPFCLCFLAFLPALPGNVIQTARKICRQSFSCLFPFCTGFCTHLWYMSHKQVKEKSPTNCAGQTSFYCMTMSDNVGQLAAWRLWVLGFAITCYLSGQIHCLHGCNAFKNAWSRSALSALFPVLL